ncbi:MAG: protein kinase [Chloroflexi bacterium]|nr:protein kinase [Chloroflexota bacterium]
MFAPGDILGPYRIEREIGRGGMAIVYLAYHQRLERPVALKILHSRLQNDHELVERFLFEARAAARLDHANIVAIHDAGQISGHDFIAMEYIEGESLAEIMRRVPGPMPVEFVLSQINQIAGALDYAHQRGIVHRDIKPSNILVRPNGHALLADFGIARAASMDLVTASGSVFGTPEYMAPEQAQGLSTDGRTDVYSLAIVAFHMLTGQTPFSGATPKEILLAHLQQPLPDPLSLNPALPFAVKAVLQVAAHKDPDQRYPTAGLFAQSLAAAVSYASTTAPIEPPDGSRSASPWGYVLLGFLIGLAALFLVAWAALRQQPPASPPPTSPPVSVAVPTVPTTAPPAVIAAASATPTPTPTPTSTAIPTPTNTASPTATSTPSATATPTLPAGPRLVYVSDRSGSPQIYLIGTDGSPEIQLTDSGRNDYPFWSPDGSLLFFSSDRSGTLALWSMRPDGSEQSQLLTIPGAMAYSISPDSQHIAYLQARQGNLDIFLDNSPWVSLPGDQKSYLWSPNSQSIVFETSVPQTLYLVGIGSLSPTLLTDPAYASWNPSWAPNSQAIAFASTRDGNAGIYTLDLANQQAVRLTPLDTWSQAPSWSPDGSAIAYIRGEGDNTWALSLMRSDGSGQVTLYRPVFPEAPARWAADSSQLAFVLLDGDQEIGIMRRDGSDFVQLTHNEANDWGPMWQPR